MKTIEKGDVVTPKNFPEFKGKVVKIGKFFEETVYHLENGTVYTHDELI